MGTLIDFDSDRGSLTALMQRIFHHIHGLQAITLDDCVG